MKKCKLHITKKFHTATLNRIDEINQKINSFHGHCLSIKKTISKMKESSDFKDLLKHLRYEKIIDKIDVKLESLKRDMKIAMRKLEISSISNKTSKIIKDFFPKIIHDVVVKLFRIAKRFDLITAMYLRFVKEIC